ncbi:MAG: single-stranded-DNA-specific exonuclease RecJ [Chitinophagaceae bacterium]|nr:MAG: single-stranded-DNA-specific exonuclease RecJ [Chitinophagaceae bacterium]
MEKRWNILKAAESKLTILQNDLKINATLCKLLVLRGIDNFQSAKDFFRPSLSHLHSPWLMKDMDKAVERIQSAFKNNEKILVYGDYDVDGTTSVACMFHFIKSQHKNTDFYIPHRYKEGYGISKIGIDFAKENGFTLIISLDCGIKSVDLIQYAKSIGIDFIVCDHHTPDIVIPKAEAVLNPKQIDCPYPYKELCGCGVGFKLIQALCENLSLDEKIAFSYLDLVATAIAADIVPITGENRILAFFGLQKANSQPNIGLKALFTLSNVKLPIQIFSLVFMVAPRVNAAGRMDDAKKAVDLFIAENDQQALQYAELLHQDNTERKEADTNITEEALQMIQDNNHWTNHKSTVLYQPHWHKGVVGIVASRVIEHHYKPTIVLTESGDHAVGSARSVPGFNLYEAVHACKDLLIAYGGHFAAAGLTLHKNNIDAFREKFEKVVSSTIEDHYLVPEIKIDALISLSEITPAFYKILKQMAPFGPENMTPIFIAKSVRDTGFSRIVKENHIRFVIEQNGTQIVGIGFNMAHKFSIIDDNSLFDIIFKIEENEWNGQTSLQLKVEDIRIAEKSK